jgi:hypothetical protein
MGVGKPIAATHNSLGPRGWAFGVSNRAFRVRAIPVLTPLRDISVHIKELPGIGGKTPHFDGPFAVDAVDILTVREMRTNAAIVGLIGGQAPAR